MGTQRPFRVLCLDGGGMRGLYQATYLSTFVARLSAQNPGSISVDIGRAFDLIVGTSTGGLVACALAIGKPLEFIRSLYHEHGSEIFPWQRARTMRCLNWIVRGSGLTNAAGDDALRKALDQAFGAETLGEMYDRRGIAIAVPAVNLSRDAPVVFKTPHLKRSNRRDDERTLVDVCMATSAAPILRSIARIQEPGVLGSYASYADGGLWANNPAVLGITEAAEILNERGERNRAIQLYSLGTLSSPGGEHICERDRHRGAWGWNLGLRALEASINAQGDGYDYIAMKLAQLLRRDSFAYRMPSISPSASLTAQLRNMDDARPVFLEALEQQAIRDVDFAWSLLPEKAELQAFRAALLGHLLTTKNRGRTDDRV
jgi:uncharacterized protein